MAFARVRWQRVSFVFLSNIFHLFYVAHSFKESYQADLRGQPHQSKRFFVRTVPKHSLYCVLPVFSLSLSLCDSFVILEFCHDNFFMDCKNPKQVRFFVWEKSKALKFIFLGLSPELVCQKGDSFSMYLSTICVGWNYLQCMILSSILSSLPLMLSTMSVLGVVFKLGFGQVHHLVQFPQNFCWPMCF